MTSREGDYINLGGNRGRLIHGALVHYYNSGKITDILDIERYYEMKEEIEEFFGIAKQRRAECDRFLAELAQDGIT